MVHRPSFPSYANVSDCTSEMKAEIRTSESCCLGIHIFSSRIRNEEDVRRLGGNRNSFCITKLNLVFAFRTSICVGVAYVCDPIYVRIRISIHKRP